MKIGEAEPAAHDTIREMYGMRAIGIVGEIDDHHKIHAEAPQDLPPLPVYLIVVRPDEDLAGAFWPSDASQAWMTSWATYGRIFTLCRTANP